MPKRSEPEEVIIPLTTNDIATVPPGQFISELVIPRPLRPLDERPWATPLERAVATALDGVRTVKEIAAAVGLSVTETKAFVLELARQRRVELTPSKALGGEPITEPVRPALPAPSKGVSGPKPRLPGVTPQPSQPPPSTRGAAKPGSSTRRQRLPPITPQQAQRPPSMQRLPHITAPDPQFPAVTPPPAPEVEIEIDPAPPEPQVEARLAQPIRPISQKTEIDVLDGTMGNSGAVAVLHEASALERRGDISGALAFLEWNSERVPNPAPLFNRMALLLAQRKHQFTQADALLERAQKLDPSNGVYAINRTRVHLWAAEAAAQRPKKK